MKSIDWMMVFAVAFLCIFVSWYWIWMGIIYFADRLIEKWVNDDWSKT